MFPQDAFELAAGFKSVNLWLGIRGLIVTLLLGWAAWVALGEYRLWATGRSTSEQLWPALAAVLVFLTVLAVFLS